MKGMMRRKRGKEEGDDEDTKELRTVLVVQEQSHTKVS